MKNSTRIGMGYDVHRLVFGRKLVLGGVDIPFEKGLEGWSDADVLTHAIIDALLGAAALGDIGSHFPPGEPEWHNVSSMILLTKVNQELKANGWAIGNIDATVVTERPKLRDIVDSIRKQLSETMSIDINQVSIKAKTSEKLGFVGREEGIAVWAIAMLEAETKATTKGRK